MDTATSLATGTARHVMMAAELKRKGVPHTLITLDHGEHGFGGADPALVEQAHQAAIAFTHKPLDVN